MTVKDGDKVKIDYTGTLDDGTVFDSSEKHGKPLEFEIGSKQVIPGFEKGIVPLPTVQTPLTPGDVLFSTKTTTSFLLTLIVGIFLVIRLWWKQGRDRYYRRKSLHDKDSVIVPMNPGTYEAIGPEYEPPHGLRPAEIGVLMDEKAHTLDVSATIVDLAVRGYLTITEIPKRWLFGSTDYELKMRNKSQDELMSYEVTLLINLFEDGDTVKLSELKNEFYEHLKKVKEDLYAEVTHKKLFAKNPESVRTKHAMHASGVLIGGIVLVFIAFPLRSLRSLSVLCG